MLYTDSGDILILMLAWQNTPSLLKQPKQFNPVIKKKTIIRYISSKLTIQILSSRNRFRLPGSNESLLFVSVVCS